MNRRTFFALTSQAALLAALRPLPRGALAQAADRGAQWAPSTRVLLGIEWRYVAGRISDTTQDVGFVISLTDLRIQTTYELLVQRQNLSDGSFASNSYTGTRTYDAATATYTFHTSDHRVSATWQLDTVANVYRLTVISPELTLTNLVLAPQGTLIAEGGDSVVGVGRVQGIAVASDYYSDWATILVDGAAAGVARVDMQGLYPGTALTTAQATPPSDYDHHWFAVAADLDGAPVWVSAWRIETGGPFWDVTIAQGSGPTWQVASYTEQHSLVAPLTVAVLAFQPLPPATASAQLGTFTGSAWRISAGRAAPADLLDITLSVPPGQFIVSERLAILSGPRVMEEAVGVTATGSVLGKPLSNVRLVVAETTAEFALLALPIVTR